MILYSGAASESQRDYWKRAHRVDGRLLSTETAGCLSKLLNKASSTTPPSNSTGPRSLSSGKHSFHLKCHVPNCTLHQIVLNGIQTNFNVVPTFSLNAPLSPFSLLIAKQAISPSPCSTSGLHSRWGVEKGENIGKRKGGTQRAQNKDWDNVLGEILVEVTQAFWDVRQTIREMVLWWFLPGMFLWSSRSHVRTEISQNNEVFGATRDVNQTEWLLSSRHSSGEGFCQRINKRKLPAGKQTPGPVQGPRLWLSLSWHLVAWSAAHRGTSLSEQSSVLPGWMVLIKYL